MKAISPRSNVSFVPLCDAKLPSEQQSKITIKALSVEEEMILEDALYVERNGNRKFSFANNKMMALHLGLVSIDNSDIIVSRETFMNDDGIYPITEECLQKIPKSVRNEIALKVLEMLKPDEEDRKN